MKEKIEQMLSGKICMRDFIGMVFANSNLMLEVNKLVPKESKNNPAHPLWMKFSYETMEKFDFRLWDEIKSIAAFDNSLGDNLNIFENISIFYCFSHPDYVPSRKYEEEFDFLLDVTGEKYGGPEVDNIIYNVISQYISVTPKTRRIHEAKEKLASIFHVSEKKYPHWINGAEWPMGVSSPMQFIDSKKIKEGKIFLFYDVDTGEFREILQYY